MATRWTYSWCKEVSAFNIACTPPPATFRRGLVPQVTINGGDTLEMFLVYRPAMVQNHEFDFRLELLTEAHVKVTTMYIIKTT